MTGFALSVARAPQIDVIASSPFLVTERLPRPIDLQRLLRGLGQHVVGSAAVLVGMQKANLVRSAVEHPLQVDDVTGTRMP